MKKAIVLLLVLAVLGGVVFAEDAAPALTFGAYSDIVATLTDQDSNDAVAYYSEFYFNFKAADMGFSATAISDGDLDFFKEVRNYKLYYNMFDGKATLMAGKLREDGGVRLVSYIEGNGFSTRLASVTDGLMVKVMPVDGLVVSAFVPVLGGATSDDFALANFGAAYTVTDIAKLVASYRLENKEIAVGVDVKALADTTLAAGFKMVDGGDPYIYLTAGKTIAGIDLGLDADIVLASTVGYGAEVKAAYGMDPYVLGVKLAYDNGADAWFANDGVYVKPYAQWNFSAGDIILAFQYNTGDSTWSIPLEFELSF